MTVLMDFNMPSDAVGVPGRENDRDGRSRVIYLSDGMTIRLEARDPYGHWYVKWGKGSTPDVLSGSYTSAAFAEQALKSYLAVEKYNTEIVEKPVTIPELKRKEK